MADWMIALIAVAGVLLLCLLILLLGKAKIARLKVKFKDCIQVEITLLGIPFVLYDDSDGEELPKKFCKNPKRALKAELRRQKKEDAYYAKLHERQMALIHSGKLDGVDLRDKLSAILALVKEFYRVAKGKLSLRAVHMNISVGSDNAATTALVWGGVSAGATLILDWLDENFVNINYDKSDISIRPNFTGTETTADVNLSFSVRLFPAISIALALQKKSAEVVTNARIKTARRHKKKTASADDNK